MNATTDKALNAIEIAVSALDAECRRSPAHARAVIDALMAHRTREARALLPVIRDRAYAQWGRDQIDGGYSI